MTLLRCLAPAKLNLTLRIVGKLKETGFHLLHSVLVPISLYDEITLDVIQGGRGVEFECIFSESLGRYLEVASQYDQGLVVDMHNIACSSNLAVRAAKAMLSSAGLSKQVGLKIVLKKTIPFQAGLGGGSSDAAAVITAVNQLFNLEFSLKKLYKIGASIGSDVPAMLSGDIVFMYGTGDKIQPLSGLRWPDYLQCLSSVGIVIVKPFCGVSTQEAYAEIGKTRLNLPTFSVSAYDTHCAQMSEDELSSLGFSAKKLGQGVDVDCELGYEASRRQSLSDDMREQNFEEFCSLLANDFEPVVRKSSSEVDRLFNVLFEEGARKPLLAGSGSSVACFESSVEDAHELSERLKRIWPNWYVSVVQPVLKLLPWAVAKR